MKRQKIIILALLLALTLSETMSLEESSSSSGSSSSSEPVCGNKKVEDGEQCEVKKKKSFDAETE